ncbi:MAG: Pycsar system effector family protein [Sphingomicrobium sp.]
MTDTKLKLGDPGYEFPKEVHNLIMAANSTNITLSGMADSKASILLGASFVVFSLSISDIAQGKASTPLLVLTMFSFIATIFGVLTVRPNRMRKAAAPIPADKVNILFFGSYIDCPREEYVDEMMRVLSSEEETYRRLTGDLWDHGHVLRDNKYKWLYWSYTFFFWGMIITAAAVVGQLIWDGVKA